MPVSSERATVFNTTQLASETVLATTVPANRRLLCTYFETDPNVPTTPYRPQGFVANTLAIQGKESTALNISGAQCFNDIVYLLSSLLKTGVITTPAGATNTRRWTFSPASSSADTFASYTVEKGSSVGAERVSGVVVNNLTLRWTRTDANLTGAAMGQVLTEAITMTGSPTDIAAAPIDPKSVSVFVGSSFNTNEVQTLAINGATGTYVLTYEGQSTAPIAVAATTAAVQTALQTLSTIGANNVTVGGTPGTSYTITFTGNLAGVDASLLVLSAFTGGPPTIVVTTPGGLTKLTRCLSCELAIPDRFMFPYTLNDADPSWSFVVQQGVDPRCTIEVEHDSTAAAFMGNLRSRTTLYAKILARGAAVETITGVPYPLTLSLLFPFKFVENTRGDSDGVYRSTFPMALMYDPAFSGWLTVTVDNGLAAL